jgi:large subunit ribosomal protein L5
MKPRLYGIYQETIVPKLMDEFKYKSVMQVPRISKVVINMGLGEAIQNPKLIDNAVAQIGAITGQRPVVTKARKSIATFKLRQDMRIGAAVTLRGARMWEFLDRLMNIALPRVRDFRGVSDKAFDGRGNYTLGVREQIIFPEIDYDKIEKIMGMNITVVTSAHTDEESRSMLRHLGMPFRKKKN